MFYCDWVNVGDKTNGCKLCPNSNLLKVKLKKLKSTDKEYDEPAILTFEASQIFLCNNRSKSRLVGCSSFSKANDG